MSFIPTLAIILSLAAVPPPQHHHAPADTGVRLTRLRLHTGVELQVAERGDPTGEPVLFLHGYTDSWFSFSTTLAHLPASVRAIVPTQRGHGDSEQPACCYRVGDLAADAVAVLDALRVPRATVVGHSMGSFVAQRVATDWPARVNRLVLIGSGTTPQTAPVLEFSGSVKKLTDPVDRTFVRGFQQGSVARPVPAAFLDRAISESEKVPARVWQAVLAGLLAPDAVSRLDRIEAETLVVWGDQDALWNLAEQDGLTSAIRRARLLTYRGVGHSPQWEEPVRFAADLMAFLKPPEPARPASERQEHAHAHDKKTDTDVMPLLEGLGTWHRRASSPSPEAQR